MRRSSYGYDSYRGRSRTRSFLTALIVVLSVVLLLSVAAFFLLQKYIVYSDDGRAHLELPFRQTAETEESAQVPVVVVTEPPEVTQTPEADRGASAGEEPLAVAVLPGSAISDGTAAARVAEAGGNAALFDMKGEDGMLGYVSQLSAAIEMGTTASQPGLNEAIRALNDTELYTVARVSCFRDNRAPRQNNGLALRSNGGNWMDGEGIRWLNPAVEETADYVAGICRELAALGFDEILLDNAGYPTGGDVSRIKTGADYDPEHLDVAVEAFYGKVKAALADYPEVKLSIAAGQAVLTGGTDTSGQTAGQLGRYADRIYAPGPDNEDMARSCEQTLTELGMTASQLVWTSEGYTPEPNSSYAPVGGAIITGNS